MWLIMRGALGDDVERAASLLPRPCFEHRVRTPRAPARRPAPRKRAEHMRIALAGAGAFGIKHLDALTAIDGVTVTSVVSRRLEQAEEVARKYGAAARRPPTSTKRSPATTSTPSSSARRPSCTRSSRSPRMRAGKHVQVEIPLADSWADAEAVDRCSARPGLVCMVGHTRRFNPSHQWIHRRIVRRRAVDPADGRADLLLPTYQHERARAAAQLDRPPAVAPRRAHRGPVPVPDGRGRRDRQRRAGPDPPGARHRHGHVDPAAHGRAATICTLSLSFNNDGPLGTFFRYICDNGTYIARYDDLVTGTRSRSTCPASTSRTNGIELQDREFVAAIREGREPNSSVRVGARLLPGPRRAGADSSHPVLTPTGRLGDPARLGSMVRRRLSPAPRGTTRCRRSSCEPRAAPRR